MVRTDVHSPSKIHTEDYYFVAMGYQKIEDLGSAMFMAEERKALRAHMDKTGGDWSKHQHGGNCHICGAWCIYTAIFFHVPTKSYIRTGMDCAEKMEMGDSTMFRTFRKNVKDALKRKAGKAKAKAMLEGENLSRVWEIYEMDFQVLESIAIRRKEFEYARANNLNIENKPLTFEENVYMKMQSARDTIVDIVNGIIRYGEISDKQLSYLKSLVDQFDNAETHIKQEIIKRDEREDCPEGDKLTITGEIVSIKCQENAYGYRMVMTVKDDKGYMVWGTLPRSLDDAEKGQRIEFIANINQSDKDTKFGFFKRPTKVKKI